MVNYILYHNADTDGHMALAVCAHWLREYDPDSEVHYIGANYVPGWRFTPTTTQPYRLFIVDYHLSTDSMLDVLEDSNCEEVHWYDHHISGIREAQEDGLVSAAGESLHYKLKCRLSTHEAGCLNAWKALHGKENVPIAVHLASIYDTWNRKHSDWADALDFNLGVRTRFGRVEDLIDLITFDGFTLDIIEEGQIIQDYLDIVKLAQAEKDSFLLDWRGLKFRAMNNSGNSLYLQEITKEKDIAGFLLFSFVPNCGWKISLFANEHFEGDVDLSRIAVSYGGGGHKGACGFYAKDLPFTLPTGGKQ